MKYLGIQFTSKSRFLDREISVQYSKNAHFVSMDLFW